MKIKERPGLVLPGPPARLISATQAARNLSDLLNRVYYRGERFIIERGGEPLCDLSPVGPIKFTVSDLIALLSTLPPVDPEYAAHVKDAINDQFPLPPSPWDK